MIKMKKLLVFLLTGSLVTGLSTVLSFAATKQKITSVSLTIESDIQVGDDIDEDGLEIDVSSSKYSVGDYEFTNSGFTWFENDIPEAKIYLHASEGYYFSLTKASSVKLKGASYVKAVKEDSSQTLVLTVKLPSLAENVGEIESASWASTTLGSWTPATGAGKYEVKIYRDDKAIGGSKWTTETTYDFAESMGRSGNYSFRVRPINKLKEEKKGEWISSAAVNIDLTTAEQIRAAVDSGQSLGNGASLGQWIQDSTGWWYKNADGTYTKNGWQQVGSEWFFFDENGYMKTGWIQSNGIWYFCDQTRGNMLVNTTTPDGYQVDGSGACIQ